MSFLFKTPSVTTSAGAEPAPPPPVPAPDDPQVRQRAIDAQRRLARRRGFASTILTSANQAGVSELPLGVRTLLGA